MQNIAYNLSPTIQKNLREIENLRTSILLIPLNPKAESLLKWETQTKRIHYALAMDDKTLKYRTVTNILRTTAKRKLTPIELEILEYQQALRHIESNWLVTKRKLTYQHLDHINAIACLSLNRREIPPTETNPNTTLLERQQMTASILEFLQSSSEHPIIKTCILHQKLLELAPFHANSKRVACLITHTMLYKDGFDFRGLLTPEKAFAKDQIKFELASEIATHENNLTAWLELYTTHITQQLRNKKTTVAKASFNDEILNDITELNPRQREILLILEEPHMSITNRDVQKKFRISQITASRDLSSLASLNFIRTNGKGRAIYYTKN